MKIQSFIVKKIGLCGMGKQYQNMKNLMDLIAENNHSKEKNMILIIDIEHWEFKSVNDLKEETLLNYITIEYYFIDETNLKVSNLYYNILKKICKTDQAFYARYNGDVRIIARFWINRIGIIIKICYIIKKDNIFKKDGTIYPM